MYSWGRGGPTAISIADVLAAHVERDPEGPRIFNHLRFEKPDELVKFLQREIDETVMDTVPGTSPDRRYMYAEGQLHNILSTLRDVCDAVSKWHILRATEFKITKTGYNGMYSVVRFTNTRKLGDKLHVTPVYEQKLITTKFVRLWAKQLLLDGLASIHLDANLRQSARDIDTTAFGDRYRQIQRYSSAQLVPYDFTWCVPLCRLENYM